MEEGGRQRDFGCRHWSDAGQAAGLILVTGLDIRLQGGRLCRLPGERLFPLSGFSILNPDFICTGSSIEPAPCFSLIRSMRSGAPLSFQLSFTSIPENPTNYESY